MRWTGGTVRMIKTRGRKTRRISRTSGRRRCYSTEDEAVKAEMEKLNASITEEIRKVRQEKAAIGKLKIDLECRITELGETMSRLESRLEKLEEREKEREEAVGKG